MGHDHAADTLLIFLQITRIRHNNIDAMHAITGKGKAGIHQHDVVAIFKNAGIFADLMQAAQRNHTECRTISACFVAVAIAVVAVAVIAAIETGHEDAVR